MMYQICMLMVNSQCLERIGPMPPLAKGKTQNVFRLKKWTQAQLYGQQKLNGGRDQVLYPLGNHPDETSP